MKRATFRFYAELNDHLPRARRMVAFEHPFKGRPSVKDAIESLGVPHTEVDLILVDGRPVGFGEPLLDGVRVSVYPVFEGLDISPLERLRPRPLREPRFILDGHLAALARLMRLAGFDTALEPRADDAHISRRSHEEHRAVLTRDRGLLKRGEVTHGYWLRETAPDRQLVEVLRRFDLVGLAAPFARCPVCNALLVEATGPQIASRVPARARQGAEEFRFCPGCRRVYWRGTHHRSLAARLQRAFAEAAGSEGWGTAPKPPVR